MAIGFDDKLRMLLVCPACRGDLRTIEHTDVLTTLRCEPCRLDYPVEEGVPFLVPECARKIPQPTEARTK